MKKYLPLIFIFIFIFFLVSLYLIFASNTKEIKLTENMYFCDSPSFSGRVKFVINKTMYVTYLEKRLLLKARHPLARYFTFYKIVAFDKKTYWVCLEARISKTADGEIKFRLLKQTISWRFWLLGISILMLLIPCGVYPYLQKKRPDILAEFSSIKDWLNVSIILGTCCFSLVLILICSDNIITSASDDPGYFKIAVDMLKLDFKGPWSFTIGLGLWYIPFVIWLKAATFYDIAIPFADFCGFVLMPATMVLIYFIIKKITSSRSKALVSVILLALFPFFYHYIQDWNANFFKSFFAFPSYLFDNRFYNMILIRGYNCMSDIPATFLIMLSCMLILYLPTKIKFVALISLIYAFACLVRINNIFFAPLIAWLFWIRFSEKTIDLKYVFQAMAVAVITFSIGFLPQFIINHLQFGSFSIFPYILHDTGAANGFALALLPTGINFMGGANHAIWAVGLTGMLFIRDRKLRNTLVLWGIPMILFFFGYQCIGFDARRFIVSTFGAMFAAIACVEVWQELKPRQRISSFIIMGAGLLFVTPSGYFYSGHLPFYLQAYSWGAYFINTMSILAPLATIILIWSLRRQTRAMLFVICFAVLYYSGSVYLLAAVMLLILLWTLYDWGSELLNSLRHPVNQASS